MRTIASHLVVVVIVFVLQISETKAACYWNGAESCLIYCINSNTATVGTEIETLWAQREHCHDKFELRLQTLPYPNNTIGSFWFTTGANVKVVSLAVYFNDVKSVLADAFNSDAFRTVKKIVISTFEVALLVNGTFNGLDELEILNINGANGVNRIEKGVLDSLTQLQEFTFVQSGKKPELLIDGLTGSAVLSKLEYVKFQYNLDTSIGKSTFIGLRNVKRLDLSSCYISTIEDNSFDPISETIEELDLSGNALTTVTYGVFSMVLPNIKTIKIGGNKWDCVCDLTAFRLFIEEYQQNFVGHICTTPTQCNNVNILQSDCFDTCDIPSTTTAATTTTTRTTTASPNADLNIECPTDLATSDTVSVKRPIGDMTISENEYGEAHLNIETEQDANSFVVMRFDEQQKSAQIGNDSGISCFSRPDVSSIPITDLKDDVIYSYCLMRKTSTSVSPLDCISFGKRRDQMNPVWLPESSKLLTITLAAVVLLVSVSVGMTVAYCLMRYNPFSKLSSEQSRFLKESGGYGVDRKTADRTSNMYTRNAFQAENHAIGCPPLPERPQKLYEEPAYAYVDVK